MPNLIANLPFGKKIGEGYFGEVYEAYDQIHGKVAVKVFKRGIAETPDEWNKRKRSLLNEGKRLKDAEHDNVVRVHQILEAETDDAVCLVMEYCENGCLADRYKIGPIPSRDLRTLMTNAALGLQTIHARGMLHRDIKPSNILLDGKYKAKVADFGLVTNDIILGYASGHGYTDHLALEVYITGATSIRSDIWAFGMTIYRLLHGQAFYENELSMPPRYLIQDGNFARKLPWLPHIPSSWRRFIRKTMNDDPEKRFQTTAELIEGLNRLQVEPNWECSYTSDRVVWTLNNNSRRTEVIWQKHSPRHHEWLARSVPLTSKGRQKTIGSSAGIVSSKHAVKTLTAFFQARNR